MEKPLNPERAGAPHRVPTVRLVQRIVRHKRYFVTAFKVEKYEQDMRGKKCDSYIKSSRSQISETKRRKLAPWRCLRKSIAASGRGRELTVLRTWMWPSLSGYAL